MTPFDTCALCPRLCRDRCPVATGAAWEAAVPAQIAAVARGWSVAPDTTPEALAREAVTACVDCGACRDACHLHRPLPEALRELRRQIAPGPPPEPLRPIEGGPAEWVAIEADERPLAAALSRVSGRPVGRWVTHDRLGVNGIESPSWTEHARSLRERAVGLRLATVDGGVMRALAQAGVSADWANEWVGRPAEGIGSCVTGGERPLGCCGGAPPWVWAHPAHAARVGRSFVRRAGGAVVAGGTL
ncbi:MAG: 4Fe-4S dicluster domain-containing protein, partial [Myxococcota bacterium]